MLHLKNALLSSTVLFLTACGGGGSGGGSVAPTPPSPPPPPQSTNTSFPASLSATIVENSGAPFLTETFLYNAPTDAEPSNFQISGPDADFFEVLIEATVPNASGDRTITLSVQRDSVSGLFFENNFENPQDGDGNNVYEFGVSATYEGRNIATDFTITVADDPTDAAEAIGSGIFVPNGLSSYGSNFASVPDLSGDGLPEIAIASSFDTTGPAGHIVFSELTTQSGVTTIDSANASVATFSASGSEFEQSNFISAAENADGSVSIAVSLQSTNTVTVFNVPNGSRMGTFNGTQDATVLGADRYIVDFAPLGSLFRGRMIDDVDGDGNADLFVFNGNTAGQTIQSGIISGDPSLADTRVDAAFDKEFTQTATDGSASTFEPYTFKTVNDLDGDGLDDVFLLRNERLIFLTGSLLRDATVSSIDLETLSATQGANIAKSAIDVVLVDDFDNDGAPTLVFSAQVPAGSTGFGLDVIDADDFLALRGAPQAEFTGARSVSASGFDFSGPILPPRDMDGDGLLDIASYTRSFGDQMGVLLGTGFRDAAEFVAEPNVTFEPAAEQLLGISVRGVTADSSPGSGDALFLDASDQLVLRQGCSSFGVTNPCSGVGIWPLSEIESAVSGPARSLVLRGVSE